MISHAWGYLGSDWDWNSELGSDTQYWIDFFDLVEALLDNSEIVRYKSDLLNNGFSRKVLSTSGDDLEVPDYPPRQLSYFPDLSSQSLFFAAIQGQKQNADP